MLDAPMGMFIGTLFLYDLLGMRIGLWSSVSYLMILSGVSCFFGLAVTCLFLPMNHYAGKVVVGVLHSHMSLKFDFTFGYIHSCSGKSDEGS